MSRWPQAEQYLSRLPHGLKSFAECTTKAETTLSVFEDFPELRDVTDVSPDLQAWIRQLRNPEEMVPDACSVAVRLMVFDLMNDEEKFLRWHYDLAKRIFSRPLYRAIMYVMSPSLMISNAAKRWNTFRRGTSLESKISKNHAVLKLSHPDGLYTPHVLRGFGESFRVALEASGGRDVRCALTAWEAGSSSYIVDWS